MSTESDQAHTVKRQRPVVRPSQTVVIPRPRLRLCRLTFRYAAAIDEFSPVSHGDLVVVNDGAACVEVLNIKATTPHDVHHNRLRVGREVDDNLAPQAVSGLDDLEPCAAVTYVNQTRWLRVGRRADRAGTRSVPSA